MSGIESSARPSSAASVADWEIVVARYGRRTTSRSEVYLNYAVYGEADGPIGMDYFVWIVRNADATIVIDTGFSRRGGDARGRETIIDPSAIFDEIGADRRTATVVVTHAHYDHIGNLHLFPEARVILARRELEFWTGPLRRKPLFHHSVEESELDHLAMVAAQPRAQLFENHIEVAPGVDVIEFGGHTPGTCGVRVRTREGTVLLACDVVHYYEELERDMPFSSVVDIGRMYSAFDEIRAMQSSGEIDLVIPGHDPATLSRLRPGLAPTENIVVLGGAR